jgi:hypothetical protein
MQVTARYKTNRGSGVVPKNYRLTGHTITVTIRTEILQDLGQREPDYIANLQLAIESYMAKNNINGTLRIGFVPKLPNTRVKIIAKGVDVSNESRFGEIDVTNEMKYYHFIAAVDDLKDAILNQMTCNYSQIEEGRYV